MNLVIQYDTANEDECLSVAGTLFREATIAIRYATKTSLVECYNINSLINFCNTGKFLDEA